MLGIRAGLLEVRKRTTGEPCPFPSPASFRFPILPLPSFLFPLPFTFFHFVSLPCLRAPLQDSAYESREHAAWVVQLVLAQPGHSTSTVLKISLLYIYMHCDCRLKSSISLLPDWSYGTLHALKSVANHWVNLCCGTLCCRLYASHKNTKCKTCTWQNTKKAEQS